MSKLPLGITDEPVNECRYMIETKDNGLFFSNDRARAINFAKLYPGAEVWDTETGNHIFRNV